MDYLVEFVKRDITPCVVADKLLNLIVADRCVNQAKALIQLSRYQPFQKSADWLIKRTKYITASDCITACGEDSYKSREQYIKEKIIGTPFIGSPATRWGNDYEEVACMLYTKLYDVDGYSINFIEHWKYPFIGVSPDKIIITKDETDAYLLEIKSPYSRIPDGTISDRYLYQIQLQLEVCNMEKCVFWDCKLDEYDNIESWLNDKSRVCGKDKGIFIANVEQMIYPDQFWDTDEQWIEWVINNSKYGTVRCWFVEVTNAITIIRDREWFKDKLPEFDRTYRKKCEWDLNGIPKKYMTTKKEIAVELDIGL